MKKLKFIVFSITLLTLLIINVSAKESKIYYTNINGVSLTEQQYKNLLKGFDEDTIATLNQDIIDLYKNDSNLKTSKVEKYIKIVDYVQNGKIIDSVEYEISENDAIAELEQQSKIGSKNQVETRGWQVTYQTTMKKLTMQITTPSWVTTRAVTIKNQWLSIPKVKSFDVIAIFPNHAVTFNVTDPVSGYQKYDGNYITYNSNSNNTKKKTGINGGVGISMNIVDSTRYSLENSMTVSFAFASNPFVVRGTYQHATSDLTLNQSKSYSFSTSGLGNVLYYSNSSIRNKYDGMRGVYLSYNVGDEI